MFCELSLLRSASFSTDYLANDTWNKKKTIFFQEYIKLSQQCKNFSNSLKFNFIASILTDD